MQRKTTVRTFAGTSLLLVTLFASFQVGAQVVIQTNATIRVMASNLTSGNNQRYESPGLNILKGLKPDVVAIQEFNVSNSFGINTAAALRAMVDTTFGTDFVYFRESGYTIPNGIISRYPFVTNASWVDSDAGVNDRGFAWARIDLPGTNDLYVVSVHLKASSGTSNEDRRTAQAQELRSLIQSNFPANAWIVVAGDFNIYSETEGAVTTLASFLSDNPVPEDPNGDVTTNRGRTERYDRVLSGFSLTNFLVPVAMPTQTFSNGLVFVSTNYVPLSEVAPVQYADSLTASMQHMGVIKDFRIAYSVTNSVVVPRPYLVMQIPGVISWQGMSQLAYTVQTKTNLGSANWLTLGTATSTTTNFSFTNTTAGNLQQFYRVTYP